MSTLPKLEKYKLFYERLPAGAAKTRSPKPGRASKAVRLSKNVLENVKAA